MGDYIYFLCFTLFITGAFGIAVNKSYFKKLLCLSLMQSAVIIFYVLISYVSKSNSPFLNHKAIVNPLPHVLMLTAIVVGVAILSVGLSMAIKLKDVYNTTDEEEINSKVKDNS